MKRTPMKLVSHGKKVAISALVVLIAGVASAQQPPSPGLALTSDLALAGMEGRIAELDKQIAKDRTELEAVGPAHAAADVRVRLRGRRLYRLLRAGLMPLSGGFAEFVEHAQNVERLKRAIDRDLLEQGKLGTRGVELAKALETSSKERRELAERKTLAETAKVAIEEEKRRREAFERAFAVSQWQGPTSPEGQIVVYGPSGKMPLESADPSSFAARKGRLTFPVAGEAEIKATTKEGGPAVEIKAPLGAVVRAVHPGRVAFADRYGTYGSLVILDHGDRCYTISANLGTADVKVGDEVSAGEKLGTVGDDGRGPSLYFEIRVGNQKVPPQAWLGL